MIAYVEAPDWRERRARAAPEIEGRVAMYALLVQQREWTGADPSDARTKLAAALADRRAAERAPDGTAFHYRRGPERGEAETIWVVRADGSEAYCGLASGYPQQLADAPAG